MPSAPKKRVPTWCWLLLPLALSSAVRGLWAPDEPRYAEVSREIFELKSFVVMHLCGDLYPDKPPLLFWLAGLLGWLSGWSAFAMRLVPLFATAGCAWLTAVLARRSWGEREAKIAPALYLGFALVVQIGPRLQIDPLLSFLVLAALVLASSRPANAAGAPAGSRAAAPAPVSARALLGAGLCTGLAALTKGPVAWLHVGLPLLLWHLLPSARPGLPALRSRGLRSAAVALAVLPVALWAASAVALEPELFRDLFYGQHLQRAVEGSRHGGPFWKNLERMPMQLMPWTPIVLAALFSRRKEADPARTRMLLWLGAIFLFFSVIPSKRDLYLLPVYPAAALLAARWLSLSSVSVARPGSDAGAAQPGRAERLLVRWHVGFFLLAGSAALLVGPWLIYSGNDSIDIPGIGWRAIPCGLMLIGGGAWMLAAARAGRDWLKPGIVGWALALGAAGWTLMPPVDELKSAQTLAHYLVGRPEAPEEVLCIGVRPEGYRFYGSLEGSLPAVQVSKLPEASARTPGHFLALVRSDYWEDTPPERREGLVIVHEQAVGSRQIYVVSEPASVD